MSCLGLDIGGANLKAADGRGWARSVPFALWRAPDDLPTALADLVSSAPSADCLAVTMTGELCDCFRTKAEGVRHIVAAALQAAAGRRVSVYLVDGRMVSADEACELPHLAAASNWHALARFACRFAGSAAGLLIDVGSTTTDIVPLAAGRVAVAGATDLERLACGELLYSGVGRTPICAVTPLLPRRGKPCRIAAELFAAAADAYLLLGDVAEDPTASWTADGRPLTVDCARRRLARMFCADVGELGEDQLQAAAVAFREEHVRQLAAAIEPVVARMAEEPTRIVVSGAGEFLARRVLQRSFPGREPISLAGELGGEVSRCAPAHALAVLARESLGASRS
jgi:(4-(4-[2-(gamma-L-glutamylamino)ethyl]phenoxymethyl)furan-2-yl)methanamine synthase